jgi:hypothetical protein
MNMTITRALAELKLLDKRITKATEEVAFCSVGVLGSNPPTGYESNVKFNESVAARIQSVTDLIKQRKKIKDSIVLSNASTNVTVASVKMTVAEAIEQKNSVEYDKKLLQVIKNRRTQVLAAIANENVKVRDRFNTQVASMMGSGENKTNYAELEEAYMKKNSLTLVEPSNLESLIKNMEESIDKFESEVDYVLSESNTVTKIEV